MVGWKKPSCDMVRISRRMCVRALVLMEGTTQLRPHPRVSSRSLVLSYSTSPCHNCFAVHRSRDLPFRALFRDSDSYIIRDLEMRS